jgi:proline iminopeptidase
MKMQVSRRHTIHYELKGSSKGLPCVFVHGGPGAGFSLSDMELFDPRRHRVLLYDQRGAGRSRPFASLQENRPHHHVSDLKKLLDHLGVESAILVGGSWGSLLSLLFAITYPQRVRSLVLWGVFLGTRKECDYYIRGGARRHFPDLWARFVSPVPKDSRKDPVPFYFEKMTKGTPKEREHFSYEWAYYETAISRLKVSDRQTKADLEHFSYKSLAPLECYYNLNNFFLEPGYVLKNAGKIADIPVYLHQGRYDFVCPPEETYKLHNRLNCSRLSFPVAGHSHLDTQLRREIIRTLNNIAQDAG